MRHARADYQRIQDPAGEIPEGEPVFLIRGKDKAAPATLRFWAAKARSLGASAQICTLAEQQADDMERYQRETGTAQIPDLPR